MADLHLVYNRRFTAVRHEQIEPRPGAYLIKGVLPLRGVAFIAGARSSGKSFVGIDLALRVGSDDLLFLGKRTRHGSVVYVGAEDAEGLALRVKAWSEHHDLHATHFDLIPHAPNLRNKQDVEQLYDLIVELARDRSEIEDAPLRLVVIDTLSAVIPGADESGSVDMSPVLRTLVTLARELDCLIVVIAHTGKDELRGIRGWSGIEGNADAILMVERDAEQPDRRYLKLEKIKNGVDGLTIGFSLETVRLGTDEDGDAWTSCVPAYTGDGRRRRTATGTNVRNILIMRAIRQCLDREQTISAPEQPGVRFGTMAVERGVLKDTLRSLGYTDDDERLDAVKVRINRDLQSLIAAGKIRATERCVWLPDDRDTET